MKKISLSLAGTLLAATVANAQVLNLNEGWNNVGIVDDFNIETVTNTDIDLIYGYANGNWRVYSPDANTSEELNTILNSTEATALGLLPFQSNINAGSALWILTNTQTTLRVGETSIVSTISGVLKDAQTNEFIDGATLNLAVQGSDNNISSTSATDGTFEYRNVSGGIYDLHIAMDGYLPFSSIVDVSSNGEISTGQIYLIPESANTLPLTVSGSVIDSATSASLDGTITVRAAHNNRTGTPITEDLNVTSGSYSVELAAGNYTFEVASEGHYTTFVNVNVLSDGTTVTRNFSLNALLTEEFIARIKLDWGAAPNDLDSHLLIKDDSGYSAHVYYGNRNVNDSEYNTLANLDRDDTSAYGPETITIYDNAEAMNKRYSYYVYNYSGNYSSTLSNSQAVVTVNYNNEDYVFSVPSGADERYWKVFDVIDGVFIPCVSECLVSSTPTLARTIGQDEDIALIQEAIENSSK